MNNFIINKLKEFKQNNIKIDYVKYAAKQENIIFSVNIHYLFLRDICYENLSLEGTNEEQSKLVNKLIGMNRVKTPVEKVFSW